MWPLLQLLQCHACLKLSHVIPHPQNVKNSHMSCLPRHGEENLFAINTPSTPEVNLSLPVSTGWFIVFLPDSWYFKVSQVLGIKECCIWKSELVSWILDIPLHVGLIGYCLDKEVISHRHQILCNSVFNAQSQEVLFFIKAKNQGVARYVDTD